MKNRTKILLVLIFVSLAANAFALPVRIVSLKPNITEILFALGVGDRVVGVTKYCDYPAEAKKLPKVADYTRPFLEPIIALKPDLVIGSKEESSRKAVLELENMGIKVAIFPFTTLEETMASIRGIASTVGKEKEGGELVKMMNERLTAVKKRWAGTPSRSVLAVVGRRPLIVFGPDTYLGEILPLIGGKNVVQSGAAKYPRWSAENVIASDPDVILDLSMGSEFSNEEAVLKTWSGLVTVRAVREKKVYPLDISYFRQSPRIVDGIERLSDLIHK